MEVVKKSRLRFTDGDDLALLREVLGHRPFINTQKWNQVQNSMVILTGKNFKMKSLRDHFNLLIKAWLERKKSCEGKLGSVDYTEKDLLCRDIFNLMKENKTKTVRRDQGEDEQVILSKEWNKIPSNLGEHIIYDTDSQHDYVKNEDVIIKVAKEEENPIEITEVNLSSDEAYGTTRYDSVMSENVSLSSPALREDTSSPTSNSSRIANPNKAKKRRAIQKHGLEEYDRVQFEIKKKEQELEERRLLLEEKKIVLEERRLKLEEKKLDIEKMEKVKNFEILEKKIELEKEDREERRKLISRSDNIIHILLKRLERQ